MLVLAAGQGTRMKSDLPKVLHPVLGRPMVRWVLDAVDALEPDSTVVVVGHGAEQVADVLPQGTVTAVQHEQKGTGHATLIGLGAIDWSPGDAVVVVYGDVPLLTGATLAATVETLETSDSLAVVLAAEAPDPSGYGRVVRDSSGDFVKIVEHKDASDTELAIAEVNSGIYAFDAEHLADTLPKLGTGNVQGEYYLPDVCNAAPGRTVVAHIAYEEMSGVNTHAELAAVSEIRRARLLDDLMRSGVAIEDPTATYVESTVSVAAGARLLPGTHLRGATTIGAGSEIGPDTTIADSAVGEGCHVWYAVVRGADIGDAVEVGPYASLRPGSVLRAGAKAGTFVETKNTIVGEGSKVPHLSYLGDATLGTGVNIGAGTITCNYDGVDKHPTVIGDDVFIGSDTMLVAPVEIGDRAVTGAGSTITKDVDDGSLAVERSNQRQVPGYGDKLRERKVAKRRAKEDG